jgi:capsular polysaccharide biosynthesis protein
MADHDHLTVERLVWASPPANVNFPTEFLVEWLRRTLNSGELFATNAADRPRRLYVSRRGARRILNEDELIAALEPLGFEVARPDELDLPTQVALFSEATIIVGPHGAGLTNMVFARSGAVLELFPPEWVGWHYYMLAQAAGHRYWYVIGRGAADRASPRARNFEVDVTLVTRTVEAMLA